MKVWSCKIGPTTVPLPPGADGPMRAAVEEAFVRLTGHEAEANFSGWGAEFEPHEQAVIDDTEPNPNDVAEYEIKRLKEMGIDKEVWVKLRRGYVNEMALALANRYTLHGGLTLDQVDSVFFDIARSALAGANPKPPGASNGDNPIDSPNES